MDAGPKTMISTIGDQTCFCKVGVMYSQQNLMKKILDPLDLVVHERRGVAKHQFIPPLPSPPQDNSEEPIPISKLTIVLHSHQVPRYSLPKSEGQRSPPVG